MGNIDLKRGEKLDPGALAAIKFAVREALDERSLKAEDEIVDFVITRLNPEQSEPSGQSATSKYSGNHLKFDPLAGP